MLYSVISGSFSFLNVQYRIKIKVNVTFPSQTIRSVCHSFNSKSFFSFCVCFESDNAITNLELEDNALQAEGTRYLMEMLQTNISIQSLVTILKLSR